MNNSLTTESKTGQSSTIVSSARGALQRKCMCGNHTIAGGECAECGKKEHNLQRKIVEGNGLATDNMRRRISAIQRKLAIAASDDPLEQEADRVADQVLSMPTNSGIASAPPHIQRFTEQPTGWTDVAPASVDRVLASPGRLLDPSLRQDMESRFGRDFSRVRVHSGPVAEQSARAVNARAYTVGHDVVFGAGRFAPGTHEGRRLIAHELTHVIQQSEPDGIGSGQCNEQGDPSSTSYHADRFRTSNGAVLQRDLALRPTNPRPQEINLTAGQIRDAINFNRRRYNVENTRLIQDVVGAQQTGTFDEETIRLIARYQEDFSITPADGKVGPDTFDQLTAELQAEELQLGQGGAETENCLTEFRILVHPVQFGTTPGPNGITRIRGHHVVEARFSPHCDCSTFQYRQFIAGVATGSRGGASQDLSRNFTNIPGGRLPTQMREDGMLRCPGRNYGHREQPGQDRTTRRCGENHYTDDAGATDQANGCVYRGEDLPEIEVQRLNTGDTVDLLVEFRGEIQRDGRTIQTRNWTDIDTSVTTP